MTVLFWVHTHKFNFKNLLIVSFYLKVHNDNKYYVLTTALQCMKT
jgi:hypothetical protein